MSFEEFTTLSDEDKYIAWLTMAVEVAHVKKFFYSFHLYQLAGFYIEMKILNINHNKKKFEAFTNVDRLDPYLLSLDIIRA